MAVSDSKFHAQFLPLKFFFESMSMHGMVFLLCMAVVLCCVGWLVWRLQGFLRHMYNHPAREVRVAWHNIARARAAFRSNSGVASDFVKTREAFRDLRVEPSGKVTAANSYLKHNPTHYNQTNHRALTKLCLGQAAQNKLSSCGCKAVLQAPDFTSFFSRVT